MDVFFRKIRKLSIQSMLLVSMLLFGCGEGTENSDRVYKVFYLDNNSEKLIERRMSARMS